MLGAKIFLESLIKEDVDTIFGYPGGVILPIYDQLTKYPQIHHILPRNEQGGAFAANGYARVSGKVGVALATSGPAVLNLVNGMADAYLDSIPTVFFSGQVATNVIGSDAFQEVDATGICLPIVKHNYLVENVKDLAPIIKEAFYLARSGRPGPVHIDMPADILKDDAKFDYSQKIELPGYKPRFKGSELQIKKALKLIEQAKRPVILAGHGIVLSRAHKEFVQFVDRLKIPVLWTLLGIGAIPVNHPYAFGMLGMHGLLHANYAVANSDLVIGIGLRFDDRITGKLNEFAKHAKVIHVDIDPAEIGKNRSVDVPIVADVKNVLQTFLANLKQEHSGKWIEQIKKWKTEHDKKIIQQMKTPKNKEDKQLRAYDAIRLINDATKSQAIITSDVGQNQMWVAQYYDFQSPEQYLSSGGLGCMGFSLPASIGAQIAVPDREVWAIMGDGGFQMNSQELMTVVQEKLNIKIVILNNGFLGMIRQWQDLFYDKNYSSSRLLSPDLVKLAEAYGIKGLRAKSVTEAKKIITQARKHKGPVLLDLQTIPEENVFPMVAPGSTLDKVMTARDSMK